MGQETEKATEITPRDPLLGRTLEGRYRLERRLGKGGTSTVYLGAQSAMDRRVAVKVLRLDLAEEPEMVERFIREARAASALQHPHIITVHDFGQTEDGYLYLAMELCEGESLQQVLARHREMPRARALHIAHQLCDALVAAHEAGVTHRDLKPENIMLTRVGDRTDFVKILDFGIARVTAGASPAAVTATGTLFGTPLYMAPEYIRGHGADHRVDLYAVGMVLWEMLTGVHPFEDDNPTTVMLAHLQDSVPPVGRIREDLAGDHQLDALLTRALQKSPTQRFQTAREMRASLEELLRQGASPPGRARVLSSPRIPGGGGEPSAPAPKAGAWAQVGNAHPTEVGVSLRRRRTWRVGVGIGVLATAVGVAAILLWPGRTPPPTRPVAPTRVAPAASTPKPAPSPPSPLPAPAPPRSAPPTRVTLRFRSTPSNATVLRGREVLAHTPADYVLSRATVRLTLRFRKRGFAERVIELTPDRSQTVQVRLRPKRRHARTRQVARPAARRRERSRTKPTTPPTPRNTVAKPGSQPKPEPKPKPPPKPRRTIYGMEFER